VKSRLTLEEIFNTQVDKTPGFGPQGDCWRWTGQLNARGYGRIRFHTEDGKTKRTHAHRVSWELFHKAKMPARLLACHTCDNPTCCNPLHVFPGTAQMNTVDMHLKGRWKRSDKIRSDVGRTRPPEHIVRGEQAGASKLTESQVRAIHQQVQAGQPRKQVARSFGVTKTTVMCIVQGRIWKHLGLQPLPAGKPGRRYKEQPNVV